MNTVTFGSVNSGDYGIYVAGPGMYNKPRRKIEYIEIPGRNGSLAIDENTFEDIDIKFQAVMPTDFKTNFDNYCAALNSLGGFQVLAEQMHPNHFWIGSFSEVIAPKPSVYYTGATFDVIFHCKPQRFLNSGLTTTEFTANGTITNPTAYTARPNLRVYGSGTVGVGSRSIIIASNSYDYIDIDCEAMDARYGSTNCNSLITTSEFPILGAGSTGITKTSGISKVVVTPRWWTI